LLAEAFALAAIVVVAILVKAVANAGPYALYVAMDFLPAILVNLALVVIAVLFVARGGHVRFYGVLGGAVASIMVSVVALGSPWL
ncbi:MAG TPA: hypothetical protein VGK53_22490, partial [Propionicimonas sp.]